MRPSNQIKAQGSVLLKATSAASHLGSAGTYQSQRPACERRRVVIVNNLSVTLSVMP